MEHLPFIPPGLGTRSFGKFGNDLSNLSLYLNRRAFDACTEKTLTYATGPSAIVIMNNETTLFLSIRCVRTD